MTATKQNTDTSRDREISKVIRATNKRTMKSKKREQALDWIEHRANVARAFYKKIAQVMQVTDQEQKTY